MCNFPIGLAGFGNLKRTLHRAQACESQRPAKVVCKDGLCRRTNS